MGRFSVPAGWVTRMWRSPAAERTGSLTVDLVGTIEWLWKQFTDRVAE
jgi:hypothetical protein